jgi:hypothetical protein
MATAAALAQRISSSGLASSSCRSAEAVEFRSSFFGRSGAGRSFGSQPEARRADRTQHVVRSKLETPLKPKGNEDGQIAIQKDDSLPRPDKTREADTSDPSFKEEPLVKGPENFGDGTSVFKGGFAQETLNGRAAMVGFTSAVVVELITGRSVWGQLIGRDGPPSVLLLGLTIVTVFVSSFAPRVRDMPDNGLDRPARAVGPFTQYAERVNGRAAMIGIIVLLAVEGLTKGPIFHF